MIMLQEKHTLEGWKSAVSILQLFLQSVDLKAMTKFTNAAAPQLTALLTSGTAQLSAEGRQVVHSEGQQPWLTWVGIKIGVGSMLGSHGCLLLSCQVN